MRPHEFQGCRINFCETIIIIWLTLNFDTTLTLCMTMPLTPSNGNICWYHAWLIELSARSQGYCDISNLDPVIGMVKCDHSQMTFLGVIIVEFVIFEIFTYRYWIWIVSEFFLELYFRLLVLIFLYCLVHLEGRWLLTELVSWLLIFHHFTDTDEE